ncbi:DUF3613 domain-containing protein [Xanthomonas massiliensis]|uniref:DUF3613 domain-containing protein n=1 Tax=Xanthomonas massiliensis TaxID=1720302 RepID=UPI0008250EAE|nr:DUF3613 domain-containing protein [Xanthomonas massiliensis]
MKTSCPIPRLALVLLAAVLAAPGAYAQQRPLTGNMMGNALAPRSAPASAQPPSPVQAFPLDAEDAASTARVSPPETLPPPARATGDARIGTSTRELFQLQASGTQAGKRLPVLGDEASASYARYLKSFEYPIPEFFETKVKGSRSN